MNERGCEHPTINRKFVGKKYEFTYVIGWLESVNKGTVLEFDHLTNILKGTNVSIFDKIFKPHSQPFIASKKLIKKNRENIGDDFLIFFSLFIKDRSPIP